MYYVYEWFVKETDHIFYVGKGCGKRYKTKNDRNELFREMVENNDCDSRIVKYFDNEKDAFAFEAERIKELKSKGQCLCNIMPGGAGGSGEYWTDELRKMYSENNVMKRPEQRERMSIMNPMKNPEISRRVANKKMRPVIIGNTRFQSVKDAANHFNSAVDTIEHWCKKGINKFGELCRYEDEEQTFFEGIRYNKGGSKSIVYMGKVYEAEIDLANDLHRSQSTITSWVKRGFDPFGNPCRYIDDDRDLVFVNRYVARDIKRRKSIIINDVHYNSVHDASIVLHIPKSTLYSYLNGNSRNPNYICTYDNQQPS